MCIAYGTDLLKLLLCLCGFSRIRRKKLTRSVSWIWCWKYAISYFSTNEFFPAFFKNLFRVKIFYANFFFTFSCSCTKLLLGNIHSPSLIFIFIGWRQQQQRYKEFIDCCTHKHTRVYHKYLSWEAFLMALYAKRKTRKSRRYLSGGVRYYHPYASVLGTNLALARILFWFMYAASFPSLETSRNPLGNVHVICTFHLFLLIHDTMGVCALYTAKHSQAEKECS